MDRWAIIFMIWLLAPSFLLSGCSITGHTSAVVQEVMAGCSLNTEIGFLRIADSVQACYKDSGIYFTIENLGSTEISGLSLKLEADYGLTMLVRGSVGPGQTLQQGLGFGSQKLSGVRSLTVYPIVEGISGEDVCVEAAITAPLERC